MPKEIWSQKVARHWLVRALQSPSLLLLIAKKKWLARNLMRAVNIPLAPLTTKEPPPFPLVYFLKLYNSNKHKCFPFSPFKMTQSNPTIRPLKVTSAFKIGYLYSPTTDYRGFVRTYLTRFDNFWHYSCATHYPTACHAQISIPKKLFSQAMILNKDQHQ